MKIVGCARNSAHGFVHIFPVKDVIVEDINCIANTNESGPTCISGRHSTVTLANIKATRNEGADGGALGFTNSKIFLEESTFQNNTAWGQGGAMSFSNCDLRMKSTELVDNRAEQGGAISVLVEYSDCLMLPNQSILLNVTIHVSRRTPAPEFCAVF